MLCRLAPVRCLFCRTYTDERYELDVMKPTRRSYFSIDIGIIGREGWSKQPTFSQDGHRQVAGELSWSPNGKYLASAAGPQIIIWSTESRHIVTRSAYLVCTVLVFAEWETCSYSNPDGAISGLEFSPSANLLAFTSLDGSFHRWIEPIPSSLPSPVTSDAVQASRIDRLLDDEFGDEEDMEEKGEELGEDFADDWIVDDDGGYGVDDEEKKWTKGRTEVGVSITQSNVLG